MNERIDNMHPLSLYQESIYIPANWPIYRVIPICPPPPPPPNKKVGGGGKSDFTVYPSFGKYLSVVMYRNSGMSLFKKKILPFAPIS